MMTTWKIAAALAAVCASTPTLQAQTASGVDAAAGPSWQIDRSHSRVGFSVRHFFTPVEGSFGDFDVQLAFDPEAPDQGSVSVVIRTESIDTGNARRDKDLRTDQFFGVDEFPTATFESRSIRRVADDQLVVTGDLTIRDVTKPVDLRVTLLGYQEFSADMRPRYGLAVAGFEAEVEVDRRDFAIGTGKWAETVVLGPDVTIQVLLETRLR